MKTLIKLAVSAAFVTVVAIPASAQRFGATPEDSAKVVQNLNFLRDEMKQKNYTAALPMYRETVALAPKSSQNLYLYGINLMKDLASKETDEAKKQKYVDTILMLYDKRVEYFNKNKGEMSYRKANELLTYRQNEHEAIRNQFKDAVENGYQGGDALQQMMQQDKFLYESKAISGDDMLSRYETIMAKVNAMPEGEDKTNTKTTVEGLFIGIPELNSCDNIIQMYTPKFQANPNDLNLIKNIRYRLSTAKCGESQLFADVVEAGYKLEPDAEAAYQLAQLFTLRGEKDKAMQYLKQAADMQTDGGEKAKYNLQIANLYLQEGNSAQAMSYAQQARSANPNLGEPYMIIGSCYTQRAKGGSGCAFGGREIFWVAVDMYQKAKSVDPKLADEANRAIANCSRYFPSHQDIFLNEYKEGASYTVNCNGVSGTTTIRASRE